MKERTSVVAVDSVDEEGNEEEESRPTLPHIEGTVEGASSCNSRLEVTKEFHTSALNAPSE
jgi:hypothetical protein